MTTIVLENTTHPGNIGAVARAMHTMGFDDLAMINPCPITEETMIRARKAQTIIEQAKIYHSVEEMLTAYDVFIGTSSRNRSLHLPVLSAHHIPDCLFNPEKRTAVLFGHEKDGLSNELLNHCSAVIEIPVADQMSLNLSHAVQVICYELAKITAKSNIDFASAQQREDLLNWVADRTDPDFLKPHTITRLRTIINKALLTETEVKLLYSLFNNFTKQS